MGLEYTCCFCNEDIVSDIRNPCDVSVLTNIDKPKTKQCNQTFYCHVDCFKEKMHPKPGYYFMLDLLGEEDADE